MLRVRPRVTAAAVCTATAPWRARSSAAVCFPVGQRAGRRRAVSANLASRDSEFRTLLGFEHLEVGVGHLGQPSIVDAAGVRLDDGLVDGHGAGRRDGAYIVDGLRNLHPWR